MDSGQNKRASGSSAKSFEQNKRDSLDSSAFSRRSSSSRYLGYVSDPRNSVTSNGSMEYNVAIPNLGQQPQVSTPPKHKSKIPERRKSKDNKAQTVGVIDEQKEKIIIDSRQYKTRLDLSGMDAMRVIPVPEIMRFMTQCLMAVELREKDARIVSDTLTVGDSFKEPASGLLNLEDYIYDIMRSECEAGSSPVVLKETETTAWVDGNDTLGPIIGNFCMKTAIKKAAASGIGIVIASNSNYIGNSTYYSHMAAVQGMVGLTFTNTPPIMCPSRSKRAALGSNPLSFGAPGKDEFLLFSMSNLVTSIDKLRVFEHEMETIPANWALDREGNVTTDAESALEGQSLLPLGGLEKTGGYKGYGMSLMVEVLSAVLGASPCGPDIQGSKDYYSKVSKCLGQCFIAINPSAFAPNGFEERTSGLMDNLRKCNPLDKKKPVLVPGDIEEYNHQKVIKRGGIYYDQLNINAANLLAKSLHVHPLHIKDLK